MRTILSYCQGLPERTFGAGEVLLVEKEKQGILYILIEGEIEVLKGDLQITTASEPGAVFGETDKLGKTVKEGEVNEGRLFATVLRAVGINHEKEYHVGARPIPLVNPGIKPITEVLG